MKIMTLSEIFDEMLGDFNDFENALNEVCKKEETEKKECGKKEEEPETHTYYHETCDKYKDGEHVTHSEKEVKDGKVLKDENVTFEIELKDEDDENMYDDKDRLQNELEEYKQWVREHTKTEILLRDDVDKLRAEVAHLKADNAALEAKLRTIKNLF